MPKIGFIFRKVDGKSSETFPIFLFNLTDFDADIHDIEGDRCCLLKSSQLTWSVGLWYLICWYTQLDNGRYGQTLFVNYILRRVQKLYVCSYHSVKLWYQVQGIGIQELIYRNKKITVLAVSKEKKLRVWNSRKLLADLQMHIENIWHSNSCVESLDLM